MSRCADLRHRLHEFGGGAQRPGAGSMKQHHTVRHSHELTILYMGYEVCYTQGIAPHSTHIDAAKESTEFIMPATILVLEDDRVLRDLLCEVLIDEGHKVVAADSLPQLLASMSAQPDLLITDLFFNAQLGGLHAIEEVRTMLNTQLPALICTAAQTEVPALKSEIERLGAHLLFKPFTLDELVEHVDGALKQPQTSIAERPNVVQLCA